MYLCVYIYPTLHSDYTQALSLKRLFVLDTTFIGIALTLSSSRTIRMDTYKEKEENSQPLPDFPLKWTPFHSCNSSYAATGLPFQNSSINSKSEDLPFNFSSSKSPVMADGNTSDSSPENQLTMPASAPKFVLEKSDSRVKLTARKSSRIASTDNVKKPKMTNEQKTSKVGVNSTMKAQEEKRFDPMVGNLKPPKPPTTTKEIIIEEKGKEKALNKSKKKNNKPICADFRISLSPETIKNDLFLLTGESRLGRNSKRRPKKVQKNLDTLFPGMLLHTITPDMYNVPEDNSRSRKL